MVVRHAPIFRRRREGRTDYRVRRALIISRSPFMVVRVSNKNIHVQFVNASLGGDKVVASANSRELLKFGWLGSRSNIPSSYLTGMMAARKAKEKGVARAVLYSGVSPFVSQSRMAAAIKGAVDAGVEVSADESVLPPSERIKGEHISRYAKMLADADKSLYRSRFTALLKRGFSPENYSKHFDEVKAKILVSGGGRT